MSFQSIANETRKVSIAATLIIFLVLIRCVTEPFRLQHYSAKVLTFGDIKPFLIGSLVTAMALLVMTVLSLFGKFKIIIAIFILTILGLLYVKWMYMMP